MWYAFYAVILAIISYFTKEIVTFIMLGFIWIALQNIHGTLKQIQLSLSAKNEKQD